MVTFRSRSLMKKSRRKQKMVSFVKFSAHLKLYTRFQKAAMVARDEIKQIEDQLRNLIDTPQTTPLEPQMRKIAKKATPEPPSVPSQRPSTGKREDPSSTAIRSPTGAPSTVMFILRFVNAETAWVIFIYASNAFLCVLNLAMKRNASEFFVFIALRKSASLKLTPSFLGSLSLYVLSMRIDLLFKKVSLAAHS